MRLLVIRGHRVEVGHPLKWNVIPRRWTHNASVGLRVELWLGGTLNSGRIENACFFRVESEAAVAEIALRCGYYDHAHFTKAFVALKGGGTHGLPQATTGSAV